MDQLYVLSEAEIVTATQFHLQHFPNQEVPTIKASQTSDTEPPAPLSSDDLGFYPDGTRRTLTDEQIALFRHSEIQRLLANRRRQNEAKEERRQQEAERHNTRRRQDQSQAHVPTRFQSDTMVHAKDNVNELSYEESTEKSKDERPQKFQWPVLGS